ncbi:MAG: LysE family transporter [Sideroxydans sp.]|nr:LysE family transporter [Sideroxydans sp.]
MVKYAGALYLVYLGVQMLRSSPVKNSAAVPAATLLKRVFRDGFVVVLLNPKTTVFFAAFLPQFLNPNAPPMFQSMALSPQYPTALTLLPLMLPRQRSVAALFAALVGISAEAYSSVLAYSLRWQGCAVPNRPNLSFHRALRIKPRKAGEYKR